MIYFIQMGPAGYIKIGRSINIKVRIQNLQVGFPDDLFLLGHLEDILWSEKELHKKFDFCRIRGEWFNPHRELLQFISTKADDYLVKDVNDSLTKRLFCYVTRYGSYGIRAFPGPIYTCYYCKYLEEYEDHVLFESTNFEEVKNFADQGEIAEYKEV